MNLYIDCDGVILDTIKITYENLIKKGLIDENYKPYAGMESKIKLYYSTINWEKLLTIANPINNSIEDIKKISATGNFKHLSILTHINSVGEGIAKKRFFKEKLNEVPVSLVAKHISKSDVVNPKNSILVDDYAPNLIEFTKKGGIGILFDEDSQVFTEKTYTKDNIDYTFLTINSLIDLLAIDYKCMKPKIRTFR